MRSVHHVSLLRECVATAQSSANEGVPVTVSACTQVAVHDIDQSALTPTHLRLFSTGDGANGAWLRGN